MSWFNIMPLFRRKSNVKKLKTTTIQVKKQSAGQNHNMNNIISFQKKLYTELERYNKILDELIDVKKRRYSILCNKYDKLTHQISYYE